MNYLIDTHVLLWSLFQPAKLKKGTRDILCDTESTIYVSSVSLWEISLKYSLKKLELSKISPDELPAAIVQSGFTMLPLEHLEAASFHFLIKTKAHLDPFDRMIIWQAIRHDMILVSEDRQFRDYVSVGLKLA
jgi:PIN domain nuclease of toxin-antitoxin system